MSSCAALHPDPEEEVDGNDDTFVDPSNFEVFDGDADQELSQVGRRAIGERLHVSVRSLAQSG